MAARSLFEVRLLGPVEVIGPDGSVALLGPRKQRALLTILALARGHVVSADRLVEQMWGQDPPARALSSLYPYVSNLRRILEPARDAPPARLVTVPPGYALRVPDAALDTVRFEQAARDVSTFLDRQMWSRVRERAEPALSWWRGAALEEFAAEPFAELEATRLEELRVVMLEDLFEARVETNDGQIIADLDRFVDAHPLRERGWGMLMRSLYAAGRRVEALRAYQRARTHLMSELGVEPGPLLREVETSILRHDPRLQIAPHDRGTPRVGSINVHSPRTAPAGTDERPETGAPAGSRLVGRDHELAVCRQVLDEIAHGPRVIVAEGEPGIGKTRLVEEIAHLADSRDMVVLWGRSLDGSTTPAFWPWLPVLRRLAELDVGRPAPNHELDSLLSPSPWPTAIPAGAEATRFVLFDDIVALIERVARGRPLMIALDDLQWADPASLELVVTLATRLSQPGVVLAVTTRDLDVGPNDARMAALAALTRMAGSRRLRLDGLDHAGTTELLTVLTGRPTDAATASIVLSRAEGNPFITTEMGRLLTTSATDADALGEIAVTIRDVIIRRLEPMPPATLDLLRLASVIGREFSILTVAGAMQSPDVLECLEVLEPAVLQRLVVHIDTNPGTYRFTHGLVSDVLVHDQTARQLATAHLRIADALDDSDDMAEIVAEHLWAAAPLGVGQRAANQLERAAHVAMARGAYESAQDLLERAVELYRTARHPPDPDPDPDATVRALTLLASVSGFHRGLVARGDSPVMARALRDTGRTLDDAPAALLRYLEFAKHNNSCNFSVADELAGELRKSAEASSDPLLRSLGQAAYGLNCWYHGQYADARTHLEMAVRSLDHPFARPERLPDDAVQLLNYPAPVLLHLRDVMGERADPSTAVVEVRGRVPDDQMWTLIVSLYASLGALMVGDPERAIDEAEQGLVGDPSGSFGIWSLGVRICLIAGRSARGDTIDGHAILGVLDERYEAGSQRVVLSVVLATMAIGLTRAGDHEPAGEAARRARAEIVPHRDLAPEPLVLLAEAVVAAEHPENSAHVSRLLNRALVVTERQGAHAVAAHIRRVALTLGHDMMTAR